MRLLRDEAREGYVMAIMVSNFEIRTALPPLVAKELADRLQMDKYERGYEQKPGYDDQAQSRRQMGGAAAYDEGSIFTEDDYRRLVAQSRGKKP